MSHREPLLDDMSVVLINFLLQRSANKIPFKLAELMPFVDNSSSALKERLPQIKSVLEHIYGLLIKEHPDTTGGKKFMMVATERPQCMYELNEVQLKEQTLLSIVLSYIFMQTRNVTEQQLISYLGHMDIKFEDDHPFFGNVKKIIQETLVKQQYLRRERINSVTLEDEPIVYYSWGRRSDIEYNKREMLTYVANVLNKPQSFFLEQMQMVQAEEEGPLDLSQHQ